MKFKQMLNKDDFSLEELASIQSTMEKLKAIAHASPVQFELIREKKPEVVVTYREVSVNKVPEKEKIFYAVSDFYGANGSLVAPLGTAYFSHQYLSSVDVVNGRFENTPYK